MKVTMKDIADKLNISINAVSIALNNKVGVSEESRIKILNVAYEMGYLDRNTKYIRTFSQFNLCVMMQQLYSSDMNFYSRVLYAVVEEAKKYGFDTLMNFFDDQTMSVPNCIEERRVAGIIVIGKISDDNIKKLQQYHIPLVMADHSSLVNCVDSILSNNKLGGFIITQYLIQKGFKKIGFFGDLNYSMSIKDRFFGFREAIDSSKAYLSLGSLDEYIKRYSITADIESAVLQNNNEKIVELLTNVKEMPQAFVCSNDKAAIALLMGLQLMNYRVPDDVSIVGFDNIDMCEKITPKLTTINVNKEKMGRRVVQRMKYLLDHRNSAPENTVLNVELLERESVRHEGI